MQFTSTFCFVAILCYAASTGIAHPLSSYDEKESDSFDIVEVDPSALEVEAKVETRRNRPAKYVTAIVRNKRSSDYSDYFSSSSEEDSFHRRKKNSYDTEDQEFNVQFPSRPLFTSSGHTNTQPIALPLTMDLPNTSNNLESESSPFLQSKTFEFEITPAVVYESYIPNMGDPYITTKQILHRIKEQLLPNNSRQSNHGNRRSAAPPIYNHQPPTAPYYGYHAPPPSSPHHGYYLHPPPRQHGNYPTQSQDYGNYPPPPLQHGNYPPPPRYGGYQPPPRYGNYPPPPSPHHGGYPPPRNSNCPPPGNGNYAPPRYGKYPPLPSPPRYGDYPSPPSASLPEHESEGQNQPDLEQNKNIDENGGENIQDKNTPNDEKVKEKILDIFGKTTETMLYNFDIRIKE